ncbi:hypothetical protein UB46_02295 [Burkholderiaceae bacterium 16]|nr:hypothetical protein UB46_02295 [Burkholderiaceae bacterium 16]
MRCGPPPLRAACTDFAFAYPESFAREREAQPLPALAGPARAGVWQAGEEAALTLGKLKLEAAGQILTAAPDDAYWQVRPQAARAQGEPEYRAAPQALTAAA